MSIDNDYDGGDKMFPRTDGRYPIQSQPSGMVIRSRKTSSCRELVITQESVGNVVAVTFGMTTYPMVATNVG